MTYEQITWDNSPHLAMRTEYYHEQWATNTSVEVTITHTTLRHQDGTSGASHTRYYIEDTEYKTKKAFCAALANVKRK